MRIVVVAAAIFLAGCATQPTSSDTATKISPDQIVAFGKRPNAPHGTLTVIRDSGLSGAICTVRLTVDGIDAAFLRTAETATLYLPSGDRIIGAFYDEAICALGGVREREVRIDDGERKRLRISANANGSLDLSATISSTS